MNGSRIAISLTAVALVAGLSTVPILEPRGNSEPSLVHQELQHEHDRWVEEVVRSLCMQGCHFEQLLLSRR